MAVSHLVYFALYQLFCFLALVVKPSPYRPLFMVPITVTVVLFFRSNSSSEALNTIAVLRYFVASDYILLTDVQRELFITGQKEPIHNRPLLECVKWAQNLYFNSRCLGWSHGPRTLPSRSSLPIIYSRFIIRQVFRLAWCASIFVATTAYLKNFQTKGSSIAGDGYYGRLGAIDSIISAFHSYTSLNMHHHALGILCVTSGFVSPQNWFPLFGSIFDLYSPKFLGPLLASTFSDRSCPTAVSLPITFSAWNEIRQHHIWSKCMLGSQLAASYISAVIIQFTAVGRTMHCVFSYYKWSAYMLKRSF